MCVCEFCNDYRCRGRAIRPIDDSRDATIDRGNEVYSLHTMNECGFAHRSLSRVCRIVRQRRVAMVTDHGNELNIFRSEKDVVECVEDQSREVHPRL